MWASLNISPNFNSFYSQPFESTCFFLTKHEADNTLQNYKTFYNSIPVIYCWTGLLPKYPGYLSYVRANSFEHYFCNQQLKHMEPLSFDRSYYGSWNTQNSKSITLDYRTGIDFLACILYIFRTLFNVCSLQSPDTPIFFLSR